MIASTEHRSLDQLAAAVLLASYGLAQEQAGQLAVTDTPTQVVHHLAEARLPVELTAL